MLEVFTLRTRMETIALGQRAILGDVSASGDIFALDMLLHGTQGSHWSFNRT